ncbi:MAG TPA: hypothetical protein VF329_04210 [Gammaproteobacteria bacterium]
MANTRVYLTRLRCYGPESELRLYRGTYVSADECSPVDIDMGTLPPNTAWWDVPLPPCPDCGGHMTWHEAGYVPGARKCVTCGSMFSVETRREPERSSLRKVDMQSGGQRVYRVPETSHWADWHDADAVVDHGVLIASRTVAGPWVDISGWPVALELRTTFDALAPVGISTRHGS